jgi:hypothetical protein
MGRKKLDKVRVQIKIDRELNEILNSLNVEKSSLINQVLWKSLSLELYIKRVSGKGFEPSNTNDRILSPAPLTRLGNPDKTLIQATNIVSR